MEVEIPGCADRRIDQKPNVEPKRTTRSRHVSSMRKSKVNFILARQRVKVKPLFLTIFSISIRKDLLRIEKTRLYTKGMTLVFITPSRIHSFLQVRFLIISMKNYQGDVIFLGRIGLKFTQSG